jgi:hypothetical protein
MGLFDEVRVEYPLPNQAHQALVFQTKDLDSVLDQYVITRRGRLVRTRTGWFKRRRCRVACPIHQDLRLHTSIEVAPDEHEWVEYVFRFTEGRVTRVRRSRDRGRFKVKRWDAEEAPRETPGAAPAQHDTRGRLQPGVHPRRPTPEEFSSNTPEKLELIDGHIPGEESLLLLLLTSTGLRRAAEMVGLKRWRSAAAPVRWSLPRPRPPGFRRPGAHGAR